MTADTDSAKNALPIRVMVANISGVLLEIVMEAIQEQPDMTVRHYENDLPGLAVAVVDQTDVLICGAPYAYPPPAICRDLWQAYPMLKVFVLTPSGDSAVMYWLSVKRNRLKTVSAAKLVNNIRQLHLMAE
jgi:hypothetical protein